MNQPYPFPSLVDLRATVAALPDYMRPSLTPQAVIWEGALSDDICDAIIEEYKDVKAHKFPGCGGITAECHPSSVLNPIVEFCQWSNDSYFKFDIDFEGFAYMQTYEAGGNYENHTDASPGQSRKLTTIALISDPSDYKGGELVIMPYPKSLYVPKIRGTLCTIPAWIPHEVHHIRHGLRRTINLGFWGPPFK